MINIFNFFVKKPYKFLGRGGIEFKKNNLRFYIDTNNFLGKDNSVEIFSREVKCINFDVNLTLDEKREIANQLKEALYKNGINSIVV